MTTIVPNGAPEDVIMRDTIVATEHPDQYEMNHSKH
jgi:hypothetical protein